MKQLIQNYKTGELQLVEVPDPILRSGGILLQSKNSLVSVGTEKLMISLAKKGYLGKALARPDLVKQVINKIKVDGLPEAYKAVMTRLDSPISLGYSSAGVALAVGTEIDGITAGDRVACFGDGFAVHAEKSYIPKNLCVKIPKEVSFEEASFVGLASIALNAIRVANLTFGENVTVLGLGLLGQLTVQMLKAFGCTVIGIDISEAKAKLAQEFGCDKTIVIGKEDINQAVFDYTKGRGADAVIIMAGAKNNQPIEMAAEISREKGRIVACGMINLDVPRQEFFKKELSVVVSRATGPGKFDPLYENKGIDYPLPFVRWTTQRNMEYFLQLVAERKIKLDKLISHRFTLDRALAAYAMILKGSESYLGVVINYDSKGKQPKKKVALAKPASVKAATATKINIGLIGAGLHASTGILPALKTFKDVNLVGVADIEGFKGKHAGQKYGFDYCVTDYHELLRDANINTVLILTRHNLHAGMIIDALKADKHVFVEKPLAMNLDEVKEILKHSQGSAKRLMVGFNRRFAPHSQKAKEWLGKVDNVVVNCRVNAGFVPGESWVHDASEGGGRVVGEVCHFVDLIQHLSGALPIRVTAEATNEKGSDNLIISIKLENGSVASILYASQGDRLLPRERFEVFAGNAVCVIDNFKNLFFARDGKSKNQKSLSLNRGYREQFVALFDSILNGKPIPVDMKEYVYTTLTTFAIIESIKTGRPQDINAYFNSL